MVKIGHVSFFLVMLLAVGLTSGCDAPVRSKADLAVASRNAKALNLVQQIAGCDFNITGNTMSLQGDCATDETIEIFDGFTLDGNGYTITAIDPPGGHFKGAVVTNAGNVAHVTHLTVTAKSLDNVCESGEDRLHGIRFGGASGTITHNTIVGINKGASSCQEGNAIGVFNDGMVEIAHNTIDDYQKTGIVANGDVDVSIHHNKIGDSATQKNLAANSIQIGFGAQGSVKHNKIEGNQWFGFDSAESNYAASAVFIVFADEVNVSKNNIRGNSDIGLFIVSGGGTYRNNRVFDRSKDEGGYDIGVANYSSFYGFPGNAITNNKVRKFDTPYLGVDSGRNKTIPGPNNPAARPSPSAFE